MSINITIHYSEINASVFHDDLEKRVKFYSIDSVGENDVYVFRNYRTLKEVEWQWLLKSLQLKGFNVELHNVYEGVRE